MGNKNQTDYSKPGWGKVHGTVCEITETEIVGRNALKTYLGCCTRYTSEITNHDPTFPASTVRKTGCTRVRVWDRKLVDEWKIRKDNLAAMSRANNNIGEI